jgi:hypothetical protein
LKFARVLTGSVCLLQKQQTNPGTGNFESGGESGHGWQQMCEKPSSIICLNPTRVIHNVYVNIINFPPSASNTGISILKFCRFLNLDYIRIVSVAQISNFHEMFTDYWEPDKVR